MAQERHTRRHRSRQQSVAHWFFPGDASWQRRKKVKAILLAAGLGFGIGMIIILFEWFKNY